MTIKHILEGAGLMAASTTAGVMTGTQNLLIADASNIIPEPSEISNIFNLITQLTILIVTLWKAIKKDKTKTTPTEKI